MHAVFQIWSYYTSRTIWPDYDNCDQRCVVRHLCCDKFHFTRWGAHSLWIFATALGKRLCFMSIISAANKVSCFVVSDVLLSKELLSQFPPLDLKEFPHYHIKRQFQKTFEQWASYQIRNIAGCECAGNVFPRHRLQRKPLVSDPGMHHGTCVTHVISTDI